jgi:hypothetical protein
MSKIACRYTVSMCLGVCPPVTSQSVDEFRKLGMNIMPLKHVTDILSIFFTIDNTNMAAVRISEVEANTLHLLKLLISSCHLLYATSSLKATSYTSVVSCCCSQARDERKEGSDLKEVSVRVWEKTFAPLRSFDQMLRISWSDHTSQWLTPKQAGLTK